MGAVYVKVLGVWQQAFSGSPPPNAATGGTESTFVFAGATFKRHLFTTPGSVTLTITSAARPFRLTMIAGGGESGYADPPGSDGTPGGSGGGYFGLRTFSLGALAMTVGVKATTISAANDTVVPGVGTCGGGGHGKRTWNGTGRTDGRPGTLGTQSNGGNGGNGSAYDTPNDPSIFLRTLLEGTVVNWGKYGGGMAGSGGGTNQGYDGMICVEYEVA